MSLEAAEPVHYRQRVVVPLRPPLEPAPSSAPAVDIVVPVYNEEHDLQRNVRRLHSFVSECLPFSAQITIADNASTDDTGAIADELANEMSELRVLHLNKKGRGRALAAAWMTSQARVVAYMDVDLATDLTALLPLLAPVLSGHSEVSIGSRLLRGSRVTRGWKRELISRVYNTLLHVGLRTKFRDAQCGFKALRADVARRLIPVVVNRNWFFDTELLVRAQRAGMRIHEFPVDWEDDADSRVDIIATAIEDLKGVWRLATDRTGGAPRGMGGQLARFVIVGALSTAAYAALYWTLRDVMPSGIANVIALGATALANTVANRRFTFGIRGMDRALVDHVGGLVAFGVALSLTSVTIVGLHILDPQAPKGVELALLTVANAVATIVRFVTLRALLVHFRPVRVELPS